LDTASEAYGVRGHPAVRCRIATDRQSAVCSWQGTSSQSCEKETVLLMSPSANT